MKDLVQRFIKQVKTPAGKASLIILLTALSINQDSSMLIANVIAAIATLFDA